MPFNPKTLVLTGALFVAAAVPLLGDSIVITGGQVFLPSPTFLDPPFGFELLGDRTDIRGETFDIGVGVLKVGDTVNLSTTVRPGFSAPQIRQTISGAAFDAFLDGELKFEIAPFTFTGPSSLSTPFSMNGRLSGFADRFHSGPRLFDIDVVGSGVATVSLGRNVGDGTFLANDTRFAFAPSPAPAPTPEPASLALVGLGLAGIARASIKAKSRRTPN